MKIRKFDMFNISERLAIGEYHYGPLTKDPKAKELTVLEVESYFKKVLEDFCNLNKSFSFDLYLNQSYFLHGKVALEHLKLKPVNKSEKISNVRFVIKSQNRFVIDDITDVIVKLFDWSKFKGADLLWINRRRPGSGWPELEIFRESDSKAPDPLLASESDSEIYSQVISPQKVSEPWIYTTMFTW